MVTDREAEAIGIGMPAKSPDSPARLFVNRRRRLKSHTTGAIDVAGTTTVIVKGTAGVKLRLPFDWPYEEEQLTLRRTSGTYAFAGIALPPAKCAGEDFFCMYVWGDDVEGVEQAIGTNGMKSLVAGPDFENAPLPEGVIDVYMLTDGRAKLILKVPGIAGRVKVYADAAIEATAERLEDTCLVAEACDTYRFGGRTRTVPLGSFVSALSWSTSTKYVYEEPYWISDPHPWGNDGCIYPHTVLHPSASPREEDHPQGCDLLTGEPVPLPSRFFDRLVKTYFLPGDGVSRMWEYNADGPVYVGDVTWNYADESLPETSWGGFGIWIAQGVG